MSAGPEAGALRPQGDYRLAVVSGGYVLTAGVTPRRGGVLVATGVVGADIDRDHARDLVSLATGSAIAAARDALADALPGRRLIRCVRARVLLRTAPGFVDHAWVADGLSAAVVAEFGRDGLGVRTTSGAATLPGGAPCEVELTLEHTDQSA